MTSAQINLNIADSELGGIETPWNSDSEFQTWPFLLCKFHCAQLAELLDGRASDFSQRENHSRALQFLQSKPLPGFRATTRLVVLVVYLVRTLSDLTGLGELCIRN